MTVKPCLKLKRQNKAKTKPGRCGGTGLQSQYSGDRGRWISESKAILVYKASFRTTKAPINSISKNQRESGREREEGERERMRMNKRTNKHPWKQPKYP